MSDTYGKLLGRSATRRPADVALEELVARHGAVVNSTASDGYEAVQLADRRIWERFDGGRWMAVRSGSGVNLKSWQHFLEENAA